MKRSSKIYIILFLTGIVLTSCTPSEKYLRTKNAEMSSGTNYVRVLIKVETDNFKINSDSGLKVIDTKNSRVIFESKSGGLNFYPEKIKNIYLIESGENILYLNRTGYRGKIELHNVLGKIYIINILNIEEYLYSVVPSEMPASWNIEALKAQAVASRTYSYYHLLKNKSRNIYDLDATVNFQVYKGVSSETPSSIEAVTKTSGMIMTYNYEPIIAYFHSTSGGKTSDDKDVWPGSDLPYLESVECKYSENSPHYEWTAELTLNEITAALSQKYKRIDKITKISFQKHNDRVIEVTIVHNNGTIKLTGNEFRLLFPPQKLKSTYFTVKRDNKTFHIAGRGWGHGVGMCQWGAKGRSEKGIKFEEILKYYYKGINFKKISNNYLAQKKGSIHLVN
ncbi:MAG TPA: SpoIID/LytB domain-containing protein [Spirochaetota bacterium]|nr:SpoIID/LytB domain-containing protein [Spirochaetota bacterium]HPS85379.1 SpoIID/LytB domain-containing protein [Spirochaetota bacterium]